MRELKKIIIVFSPDWKIIFPGSKGPTLKWRSFTISEAIMKQIKWDDYCELQCKKTAEHTYEFTGDPEKLKEFRQFLKDFLRGGLKRGLSITSKR